MRKVSKEEREQQQRGTDDYLHFLQIMESLKSQLKDMASIRRFEKEVRKRGFVKAVKRIL
jgi:hypothetical protein